MSVYGKSISGAKRSIHDDNSSGDETDVPPPPPPVNATLDQSEDVEQNVEIDATESQKGELAAELLNPAQRKAYYSVCRFILQHTVSGSVRENKLKACFDEICEELQREGFNLKSFPESVREAKREILEIIGKASSPAEATNGIYQLFRPADADKFVIKCNQEDPPEDKLDDENGVQFHAVKWRATFQPIEPIFSFFEEKGNECGMFDGFGITKKEAKRFCLEKFINTLKAHLDDLDA